MLKIDKARWLVDSYIEDKSDEITDKAIDEGIRGLESQMNLYGIDDYDDKIELAILGIIAAYLYIEKQINDKLDDGEAQASSFIRTKYTSYNERSD